MVMLTLDTDQPALHEVPRLCSKDFPREFVDGAHYQTTSGPIEPQHIYHNRHGCHSRLFWRVSWRQLDDRYFSITFLLDTGAPRHMYLTGPALRKLEDEGLVHTDEDMCASWVWLCGRRCGVQEVPACREPATAVNVLGLHALMQLGLALSEDEPHFTFNPKLCSLRGEEL